MEMTKKRTILGGNKLATTVVVNSLNFETVVSQPSNTQDDVMVDGLDYVFNQAKFEEYLSSSSSRSSSPKCRRILSPRKTQREDFPPIVVEASLCNIIPAFPKAVDPVQSTATLTKRARQRQRQRRVRQLAKALEPMDGMRYYSDSQAGRIHQTIESPQQQIINASANEEWVLVKSTHSTKEERVQKHRARNASTRAAVQKAQQLRKKESAKEMPRSCKVWILKFELARNQQPKADQVTTFGRDSPNCLGQKTFNRDSCNCLDQRDFSADILPRISNSISAPITSPSAIPLRKPEIHPDTSKCKIPVVNCLGPLYVNRGKTPMKERLGPVVNAQGVPQTGGRSIDVQKCPAASKQIGTHQYTCSCTVQRRNQEACTSRRNPIASHLSIPQGVREPVKTPLPYGGDPKHVAHNVMRNDRHMILAHSKPYNPHSQKKTCLSNGDGVILGGGRKIHKRPHRQTIECSGHHADECFRRK